MSMMPGASIDININILSMRIAGLAATFLFLSYLSFTSSTASASASVSTGCRPNVNDRVFTSTVIDEVVVNVTALLKDPVLAKIFECTFPNTLDTTVNYSAASSSDESAAADTFIITGDINAMWLRDSTWQVNGYIPYAPQDPHLLAMLVGVHNRHVDSVLIDGYANAFNQYYGSNGGGGPHQNDYRIPPMNPLLFEGKYELDSLCSVLHFTWQLYTVTEEVTLINTTQWLSVVNTIYAVLKYQQQPTSVLNASSALYYAFARQSTVPTDTLLHTIGPPARFTGMIRTAFRPSDDATRFQFNVASNMFAVIVLRRTALLFRDVLGNVDVYTKLTDLSNEIENGIHSFGVLTDNSEDYFAYEVDGYGSHFFMDDGNVPSLLSLPYLGLDINNNDSNNNNASYIYANTRKRLLSLNTNPYYFRGLVAEGIGSPHTGANQIWPMAVIMRAMTSDNDTEIMDSLNILKSTTDDTYFMHESFDKNNPAKYTRSWFAWCNSLFGALILQLIEQRPWLVVK